MSASSNKAAKANRKPATEKRRSPKRMTVSPRGRKAQRPLGRTSRSAPRRSDDSDERPEGERPVEDVDVDEGVDLEDANESTGARNLVEEIDEIADRDGASDEGESRQSSRARNENSPGNDSASYLAMYFREMASLDVLRPEQEFKAAREIEALEIDVWKTLLSHAPAADCVLRVVEITMENSLPEFRGLRRAATEVVRSQSKAGETKLHRAAGRCAAKLRSLDTDRLYVETVLAELDRIRRDAPGRIVGPKSALSATSREFDDYFRRVRSAASAAEQARSAFVKANLRLVVSIARRFNHGRMALADLIQEGNIGLMKAVERYDYRRGFRFSTYASWWIRHAISRALADKGREVRLPVHMIDAYHRLSKAKRELTAKLGRQPTSEELADVTNLTAAKIEKMRTYLVDQSFSLDRPVNDEDGRHFVEFLQDPSSAEWNPADRMGNDAVTDEVRGLLGALKPIEADILRQRFGLDNDQELTLKEIGEKYNLSRERIRQLQEQALAKMRRALQRKDML